MDAFEFFLVEEEWPANDIDKFGIASRMMKDFCSSPSQWQVCFW